MDSAILNGLNKFKGVMTEMHVDERDEDLDALVDQEMATCDRFNFHWVYCLTRKGLQCLPPYFGVVKL